MTTTRYSCLQCLMLTTNQSVPVWYILEGSRRRVLGPDHLADLVANEDEVPDFRAEGVGEIGGVAATIVNGTALCWRHLPIVWIPR